MAYSASQIRWKSADGSGNFIPQIPSSGYSDINGRPLTVVERRAFFERLHATAVSCTLPLPPFKFCKLLMKEIESLSKLHLTLLNDWLEEESDSSAESIKENADSKENVTPESIILPDAEDVSSGSSKGETPLDSFKDQESFEFNESISPDSRKEPPAKPRRTFAHNAELTWHPSCDDVSQKDHFIWQNETNPFAKSEPLLYDEDSSIRKSDRKKSLPSVLLKGKKVSSLDLGVNGMKLISPESRSVSAIIFTNEEMLDPYETGDLSVRRDERSQSSRDFITRTPKRRLMRTKSFKEGRDIDRAEQHSSVDNKLLRCVTRAKLVRRKTLALYNQQEAAFCKRMSPQLFDRAINVKLVSKHDFPDLYNGIQSAYLPLVSYKFPERANEEQELQSPVDCADLFMPDFTRIKPIQDVTHWTGNEEFMLTLTDGLGRRSFAYCMKYLRKRSEKDVDKASTSTEGFLPEVFAIVSPIHAPPFYSALVRECVNYIDKGQGTLKNFLEAIFQRPFPSKGSILCLVENTGSVTKREFVIKSEGPVMGRADCSLIIRRIGVEVSVSIIAALLSEQKVLIGGDSVQSVSHAVQTFAFLLQPFSWPYTLVPVLPDTLLELANSPTPCLLGVLRTNMHKLKELLVGVPDQDSDDLLQNDVVIVDLDGGIFVPHPSELSVAAHQTDFKERSAVALCERLLLPKKLAISLINSFKEALAGGTGPRADEMLQKAMLVWFATLLGHYKTFSLPSAYLADLRGESTELRTALAQYILAHPSKTSRRFIEWFVETGLFRDWLRKKASSSSNQAQRNIESWEDAANQKFDELAQTFAVTYNQGRLSSIFTRASTALFRSNLLKGFR